MLVIVDMQGMPQESMFDIPWLVQALSMEQSSQILLFGPAHMVNRAPVDPIIKRTAINTSVKGQYPIRVGVHLAEIRAAGHISTSTLFISNNPGLRAEAQAMGLRAVARILPGVLGEDDGVKPDAILAIYHQLASQMRHVPIAKWAETIVEQHPVLADKKQRFRHFGTSRFVRIAKALGLIACNEMIIGEQSAPRLRVD